MFDKNIFASRLMGLRSAKGLSREHIARAIGVSYFTIGKMETAERAASIEVLYALADFFAVSIDYLVGRSNDPTMR